MSSTLKKFAGPALSMIGIFAASQSYADLIATTPGGSSDTDGPIAASADFSLSGDVLTIQLTSLIADPTGAGQLVSGVTFNISGATSSTLTTLNSDSGNTATLIKGGTGSYTSTASTGTYGLSAWGLNASQGNTTSTGTGVNLSVFGGSSPYDMIIGPDSKGKLSGTAIDGGLYDNANSSITGMEHEPVVLGSATFSLTIDGLSSLSQLNDIKIDFGTGPDTVSATCITNVTTPVPEPTTIISGALMLVPLSVQLVRKMRNRKQEA